MNCLPLTVSVRSESIGVACAIMDVSHRLQTTSSSKPRAWNLKPDTILTKFIIEHYLYTKIQLIVMNRKLIGILFFLIPFMPLAQTKPKVMVMEIKDEIDPRMLRYVKLSLEHAEKIKADYVIVD